MRTKHWIAAPLVALVASLFGGAWLAPKTGSSPVTTAADPVLALTRRISEFPSEPRLHAQLGSVYLEKARDEADPAFLPQAEEALERSLQLRRSDNPDAALGMALLANARHDFTRSVRWAREAIAINPAGAQAYGVLGDALFELGRVGAADRAYERMVNLRPSAGSYVRISYALQSHGRTDAAIVAMRRALQAAGPRGETAAWVRHQLGDISAGSGRIAAAERQNRIGVSIAPGFVPPTVGLAEAHIARGELEPALAIMESAAHRLPTIEYMVTLGELYEATGRHDEAVEQYEKVAAKLGEYRAAGVRADADFTVFYADHGLRLRAALREARGAYRERPTAKIADALGWVLHALGREREAWSFARRAMLGTPKDATVVFHAGRIALSSGRRQVGLALMERALRLDPRFSLVQAPIARKALEVAGGRG